MSPSPSARLVALLTWRTSGGPSSNGSPYTSPSSARPQSPSVPLPVPFSQICGVDVVLMTERNPSLHIAIAQTLGSECNSWCLRHLKENFSSFVMKQEFKTKRKDVTLKIITDIAYARDEHHFMHHLTSMYMLKQELGEWVKGNGPEHWENAKFPKKRWDWLYTNLAESLNYWLIQLRDLNIYQFMKNHVLQLSDFLQRKKAEIDRSPRKVGPRIEEKIRESQGRSGGLMFRHGCPGQFTVWDVEGRRQAVDLLERTCTCLEWQQSGIPCPHAMVVIGPAGLNVYDLVDWYYTKEAQDKIYAHLIPLVPTHDEPTLDALIAAQDLAVSEGADDADAYILPLPPQTKRRPGRPKKKRIESQFQEKRITRCSRCGEAGHNRASCINALSG